MATNGTFAPQEQFKGSADQGSSAPAMDGAPNASANNNLSKDEVAWYFVEQYYTTLSKSPEKLHLFYGKRSQFVYGLEAEVANVSVGRPAIQQRISNLDFQDCKVRVSNVDSQASFDNIVIQVIGETSNKAGEPKKFVQTFVLAQQPSGYFVLNDILRYISEDGDEESGEAAEAAAPSAEAAEAPAPVEAEVEQAVAPAAEPATLDTAVVEEKLQEAVAEDKDFADANGSTTVTTETSATLDAQEPTPAVTEPEAAARQVEEEDIKEADKPKEPSPTPVAKPAATQPAETAPEQPIMPPKPMTWASRAAAAAGPRPVVPLPKTATPPAGAQSRAPAPAAAPAAAAPAAAPAATTTPAPAAPATATPAANTEAPKEVSGWQTAGADSKRQNRPQSISQAPTEKEGTMGYVKYVTDKVQDADLKAALAAHGELTYFDINRQKNCAFVEYKTIEGYQAAVSANPHVVNGENIVVEPRRPKSNAYGGSNYGSGRGSVSGRGRGGFDGNRPGQGNPRGNFSGQNRGRGGMPRGRGGPQATNA
ncbi:hypothetical protein B0I35DRAFT_22394 [Stachybotrys elegans]|uniref:NTF2 domain-containing protein n=1 Tax=Stachybotrys elegans TaxID=80388 RepID=A0A8K0T4C2_9HYPO|nr:hypothetical protein B0I35DRAFT_22394 [Stachybotrys elegans]